MKASTINYESLPLTDIYAGKKPLFNRLTDTLPPPLRILATLVFLATVIGLFVGGILAMFTILVLGFVIKWWLGVSIVLILTAGALLLRRRQKHRDSSRRHAIQEFARQNHWQYGRGGELIRQFSESAEIVSAKESNTILYSIKGSLEGTIFELLVGWKAFQGEPLQALTPQLFIQTARELPIAALVSRTNTDHSSLFDNAFLSFRNPVPVSLEGDFDDSFQLYVPHGGQVSALSFVAPDFMQTAKSLVEDFTILMSGHAFSLLPTASDTVSRQTIKAMFEAAEALLTEATV